MHTQTHWFICTVQARRRTVWLVSSFQPLADWTVSIYCTLSLDVITFSDVCVHCTCTCDMLIHRYRYQYYSSLYLDVLGALCEKSNFQLIVNVYWTRPNELLYVNKQERGAFLGANYSRLLVLNFTMMLCVMQDFMDDVRSFELYGILKHPIKIVL